MNNKKILVILLIFLKKGGRIYSILNISNSKMNKKVIAIILVFLVGIIGGILLSRVGNNAKIDMEKNNTNVINNKNSNNNTTKTENEISNNESKNTTTNANTTKSENTTSKNEIRNTVTNTIKKENETSKNNSSNTTKNDKTKNTQTELSTYKAIWQYPDSTYPEQEFRVKSISDSKVNFDYIIDGITTFENVSASVSGNIAKFDIKNEGGWNIKGTITFENNKVIFNIKESSSENIPTGSTTFKVKSSKSAF